MRKLNQQILNLMLSLLFSANVWAANNDSHVPATFDSDQLDYNQKTRVTIFTGHVKMDQGTTHLFADKVTLYSDKDNKITKLIAIGKQAHYSTLPEGQTKVLDAFADTIEYYPPEKKAILIGNAFVDQPPNQLRGSHIIYDMIKQQVLSLPANPGQQTVVILQPNDLPGGKPQESH